MVTKANVAEVKSNLAGGMPIVQADNRIVLDRSGSYIENKRIGARIKIELENCAFVFDFWVPAAKRDQKEKPQTTQKGTKSSKNRYAALQTDDEDSMEVDDVAVAQTDSVFVGQADLI